LLNRGQEIREAGEGAERGSGGSGEAFGEEGREVVEGVGVELGEPILKVTPPPFEGIQLGGRRREEPQRHLLGQVERLGLVKGASVEQQQVELGGTGRREVVEEEVKALGVEQGQFQKEALAGLRLHGSVQVETLEAVGRGQQGLDPARGEPAAHEGEEPTATFLLCPHPPLWLPWLEGRRGVSQEVAREGRLKLRAVLRLFFGCERRGALGWARNLERTKACTAL
jgi:hypothetical protein